MKYYIITRSEMELLEKAGIAVVACPKTKSGYDWSAVESITVDGKTYDSEIHYKRHGNTGEFTSNGVVSYLESEDGDKIKLAPIRYTKKLAIKGYDDVEKIMKNTFRKGEKKTKKTYKLIADTNNGVTLVDSFDDFHGIEIIDEEAFLDNLDYLSDNDTIGAEVSKSIYESIKKEYGVRE